MKRKRGRKPGKKRAAAPASTSASASASPEESPPTTSTEEESTPEDQAEEDAPAATAAAAAPAVVPEPPPPPPPVSPPSQPPRKPPSTHADITYTKPKVGAVYGRVKLKFKKPVEPTAPQQQLSSSAPAAADAAKPGHAAAAAAPEAVTTEAVPEKVTVVAMTDGQQADVQTASEMSSAGSEKEKAVRKVVGIKIKSAGLSSAAAIENSTPDAKPAVEEDRKADEPPPSKVENASEDKETEDTEEPGSTQESEKRQSTGEQRQRDDKELAAALEAIKKVMKMDAAEPFNVPVDPVALGIPDYFDIIDTPMDFGTICQNLEHGDKYMNSEDVYKDVQFIWDNCTKYNSKGDYVVELMKRVKKAFMKHWLAAGLYSDVPEGGGNDNTGDEDGKSQSKSKSKNKKRRPGNDRHKNDCVCAVCQVTRRKKEKDELAAIDNEITMMDNNTLDQHNLEGNSGANNPDSHDTSSSHEPPRQTDMYKEAGKQMIQIFRWKTGHLVCCILAVKMKVPDNTLTERKGLSIQISRVRKNILPLSLMNTLKQSMTKRHRWRAAQRLRWRVIPCSRRTPLSCNYVRAFFPATRVLLSGRAILCSVHSAEFH